MTKFRQIFFILISGILVDAPVAFAAHRDDNSHQPSVQELAEPLCKGLKKAECQDIVDSIDRISAQDRVSVCDYARRLITPEMSGDGRGLIIKHLATVPASERHMVVASHMFFPSAGGHLSGWMRQSLSLVPASEMNDFIRDVQSVSISKNPSKQLIQTLAPVPASERGDLISEAQRLFEMAIPDNERRTDILYFLARIPAVQRNTHVTEVLRLYREAQARGETQGAESSVMVDLINGVYRRPNSHPAIAISGRAFEVHNYADTQVAGPADGGPSDGARCESPKRLNEAVLEAIQARLARGKVKTLEFSRSFAAVNALAAKLYTGQELTTAKAAIARGLDNGPAQRELCQVYAFVRHFHPARLQLWAKQFIGESITAYGVNAASCTKGITERIVIGLRGIDPELDKLFGQAEGPASMTILLAQSNFRESAKHATWMAKKLVELGATPQTTPEEMGQLYKAFLEKTLKEYGLEHNKTFEGQADAFAELIEGDLDDADSHLKPALAAEFAKMKPRKKAPPVAPRPKKVFKEE
ncbi:MAG: hypothetical protein WCG05_00520 [Alphaproteobacteria bacterium]